MMDQVDFQFALGEYKDCKPFMDQINSLGIAPSQKWIYREAHCEDNLPGFDLHVNHLIIEVCANGMVFIEKIRNGREKILFQECFDTFNLQKFQSAWQVFNKAKTLNPL